MNEQIQDIQAFPLKGGVDTTKEIALLDGRFSTLQNLRPRYDGFEKRKGQIKLHTTASSSLEALNLFQFNKGRQTERYLFRQAADGSIKKAANNPPATTTGDFGSNVLSAVSGAIPASVSTINDMFIFSDAARQHQIWTGNNTPVEAFIVNNDNSPITAVPETGNDYTQEVTDSDTTTSASITIGVMALTANGMFVMTPVKANKISLTIPQAASGTTGAVEVKYWTNNYYWSYEGQLIVTDTTAVAGSTMKQSGSLSWTSPSDDVPRYMFGRFGYWYWIGSMYYGITDLKISEATFDTPNFQNINNLWDGVLIDAVEVKVYKASQKKYYTFDSSSVDLSKLKTDEYVYVASPIKMSGIYIDVGATANVTKAAVTGTDISFISGGAGNEDIIKRSANDFLTNGFEAGQSIVITGSTSNNKTTTIVKATSSALYVPTGVLLNEGAGSAVTIAFGENVTRISEIATWTGSAYETYSSITLNDSTDGLTRSGFITFNHLQYRPAKFQFEGSFFHAYWYRFKFDKQLSEKVNVSIELIPVFDMSDLGSKGICSAQHQERMLYVFDREPNIIHVSSSNNPQCLNGNDYTILIAGDGRKNPVKCIKSFNENYALVWQEERGSKGGCTTLIEGNSVKNYNTKILSTRVGILNAKSACILDGVEMLPTATDAGIKSIAFWLSKYGVYASDGDTVILISESIQNYFDPKKPECIRAGHEDKMWINYDSADNCLRLGLVSGSSATTPNIFPVFHVRDKTWSFDKIGQSLTCFTEVESESGDIFNLQIGGGADGFVYQCNQTYNDDATPIDAELTIELDGKGGRTHLIQEVLRCKTQSSGNITQTISVDGNPAIKNTQTLSMTAQNSGDVYKRHRFNLNVEGHHLSIKLKNSESNTNMYLEDIGFKAERKGSWT